MTDGGVGVFGVTQFVFRHRRDAFMNIPFSVFMTTTMRCSTFFSGCRDRVNLRKLINPLI